MDVLHVSIDENNIVRQNGAYVGQGESFFTLLVNDPETLQIPHIVITYRDKEWELRAPYRFSGTLTDHLATLPARSPSFIYTPEQTQRRKQEEEQRKEQEAEERRRKREEYRSRPSADPSLDVEKLWTPRFTRQSRRLKGSASLEEFLRAPEEKNIVQGLSESQVYPPGEVLQKASRFNSRGIAMNKERPQWGKRLGLVGLLVLLVGGVVIGVQTLTQTSYTEFCYDTRTLFVLPQDKCLSEDEYTSRGWIEEGSTIAIGEQASKELLSRPTGNIKVLKLEEQAEQ